jgi:hypothetical protein
LLSSGGLLECGAPTLVQHKSKQSWNHDHPEDVWNAVRQHWHYIGVMNPGIITIRRKFGMRCANTRTTWDNPHEEGDSTGNYQFIYSDSGRLDQNSLKIL